VTALPWALVTGLLSALAALALPLVIAALPERDPADETTYAVIASPRGLALRLACVAGGVGFALGWARAGQPDLPAFAVIGVLGVGMGYVDLRRHLLPDRFTVAALGAGAVLLGAAALVDDGGAPYARAWACAGALLAFYLVLALIYPAGLGLGDVKLAASLGLHLGWLSWGAPVVGTFAGFTVGALASIVLLVTGRANRRTAVPFGPSMLVGALIAVLWTEPITAWYLR
jgi:leader peptidase (prepilin peptidase) / N-methyltransferase